MAIVMDIARFKIITYIVRHINNRYIDTVVNTWLVKPIFDVLVVFFAHHYLLSTVVSVVRVRNGLVRIWIRSYFPSSLRTPILPQN
jgi:hypothetical protein